MHTRTRHLLWLSVTGIGLTLFVFGLAPAGASSTNISHAYHMNTSIPDGGIVSLDPNRADYVEPANVDNGSRLIGVIVASDDTLIAVGSRPGTVQVATSGNVSTAVSTLAGDIKVGDQIAVSPFNGVGMKALPGSRVIGIAQSAFNAHSRGAVSRKVTGKGGVTSSVEVGYVQLTIATGTSAAAPSSSLTAFQKFAKSLTGRTISTARVVISLVVATVSLVALITLVYASIYGSILSIGRNPLAKPAIFRTLGSVLALAGMILVLAAAIIYLLLR